MGQAPSPDQGDRVDQTDHSNNTDKPLVKFEVLLGFLTPEPALEVPGFARLHGIYTSVERPSEKELRVLAEPWAPYHGSVALFAWHCYNTPAL
ncbi:MAG: hypothetical protein ACI9X4_000328 [Glaciecola sp.]|jgi:hypothetical protein